jgi:methylated-DNA-protein-cysteine methyltransferase-like protein
MELSEKIYRIVRQIPKGKVLTYGDVARLAGIRSPRVVGLFLHRNPDPVAIPCHRVVNRIGAVSPNYAFGGANAQKQKLLAEGAGFIKGKVDLSVSLWIP